jgi:hypothetical protein
VAALEAELAKAKKHSGNSSKPPSSDIVDPPRENKPGRPRKRKIGGQPGHARHQREPFLWEELDGEWIWYYPECPCCGGRLTQGPEPARVLQHVELLDTPVRKEGHSNCAHPGGSSSSSELSKIQEGAPLAGPALGDGGARSAATTLAKPPTERST